LGDIQIDFESLDKFIRNKVPHGHGIHQRVVNKVDSKLQSKIEEISKKTNTIPERHLQSLGSLGGGNHFIEINEDKSGQKYLVIHSGSRNLGLQVAKYHQKKAEEYCSDKVKE